MKVFASFYLLLLWLCALVRGLEPPLELTKFGVVRGMWKRTTKNSLVASFLGIPYAEPPIGNCRFKKTRPWNTEWTEARNATSDGSKCPQLDRNNNLMGNEDCLYLNIFVRYEEKAGQGVKPTEKLPVIVFIPGGGFIENSNNSTKYGPEYLLEQKVVLVTVNYRLDFLGFFSLGNGVAPGNYGLKDVFVSLKWIKKNIESFGGDPDSVTLWGHSAGAVIAQFLSFSNKTNDYFHRVILQSASVLVPGVFQTRNNMRKFSLELARLSGCSRELSEYKSLNDTFNTENDDTLEWYYEEMREMTNDVAIKECMKNLPLKEIFKHARFFRQWHSSPLAIFTPTLEADTKDAIVTAHPLKVLKDGSFRKIPVVIGYVQDEGFMQTYDVLKDDNRVLELVRNYSTLMIPFLYAQQVVHDTDDFIDAIVSQYFAGNFAKNFQLNITAVATDFIFVHPIFAVTQKYSRWTSPNIYFYSFTYQGYISDEKQKDFQYHYTVSHGDDLYYTFPYPDQLLDPGSFLNPNDRQMMEIMTELWGNFAKNGTPSSSLTPDWEPYQNHSKFMRLGNGRSPYGSISDHSLESRMRFWEVLMNNVSTPLTEVVVTEDLPTQEIDDTSKGAGAGLGDSPYIELVFSFFVLFFLY